MNMLEGVRTTEDTDISVRNLHFLRGPNLYAYMPVMHLVMEIGAYDERPSNTFTGFTERLAAWLPGLETHRCSVGRPGGFIERLRRGTYLPHITEHVTLELQNQMGFQVGFGRARGTGEPGVYDVVIAYKEEEPARAAFETALELTLAAMHDRPFDVAGALERLLEIADRYRPGPSTEAIVRAARKRDIPVLRLIPDGSLFQLGWGVHQKRIRAAETSHTSAIAVDMCQEKELTNQVLRRVGISIPEGRTARSADEAWKAACDIGLPVVIKPPDGNQGKGVSVNLTTEAEVREAYDIASVRGRTVLVERFIEGDDYRLLVVNGRMVAAARRDPAQVIGDGVQAVRQLVAEVNRDPRRRPGHSSSLTQIKLDDVAAMVLSQQGLGPDSAPEGGRCVRLRTNANLSTGGTSTDVTDDVHPRNAQLAQLAAQMLDLDIAGIDILCKDIRRPLGEQGGAIVEVNAVPGLRMHLEPSSGQPREVGVPIVDMLYPDGATGRIPVIAVTGTNGKTTVTRLITHMYDTAHYLVGMTSTEGAYIDNEQILKGDCSGPQSARAILLHPRVEVAVLETARGGILREGLAFDKCAVGVVTNISGDHLGLKGINTIEQLARVKQVVIESVADEGAAVLNADDPLVAEMAAATDADVVYFGADVESPVMGAHLASGGRGVFVKDGTITLAEGKHRIPLVELDRVEFTAAGRIRFQVMNALAATAAAWSAGLNPAMIARALSTFTTDSATVPGRFNISTHNGVEIVLDYAHNLAAIKALGEAVQGLGARRTVMVATLPGDRRDEDVTATIQATIPYVDEYVLYDNVHRRGRAAMEMPRLLRSRLPEVLPSRSAANLTEAIELAWTRVKPGDRLIIIPEEVDMALEGMRRLAGIASEDESSCEAAEHVSAAP